jgi:hypothetical protein
MGIGLGVPREPEIGKKRTRGGRERFLRRERQGRKIGVFRELVQTPPERAIAAEKPRRSSLEIHRGPRYIRGPEL